MNINNVIISHHAPINPSPGCAFLGFGATSNGKLRVFLKCGKEKHFIEYNMSNILPGIIYRHEEGNNLKVIEGVWIENSTLYVDVHDKNNDIEDFVISDLNTEFKYERGYFSSEMPEEVTHNAVFPPAETHKEWVDRMERMICRCAHNFENAFSQIQPNQYDRLRDFASQPLSSNMSDRMVNTSLHCRMQIGWLWARVDRLKRGLTSVYTKATLEPMVQALYNNMDRPEKIKQFFHRHNIVEWKKLRNDSGDDRHNGRKIHLWADDYTAGTLLADLNARATINNIFYETTAKAAMVEMAMTEYKKAASHPNYDVITERVY